MKTLILMPALLLATTAIAFAAPPVKTAETKKGPVLAAENGMTLYTFKGDKKGVSNCNNDCTKNWPPFTADATAKPEGAYTVIDRKDGTKQWAKDGMPLYFFAKDKKTGDMTGDGMLKGEWKAAKP